MNKAVITLRGFNDIFSDESRSFIIGKKIEKIRFNEDYLVLEFELVIELRKLADKLEAEL